VVFRSRDETTVNERLRRFSLWPTVHVFVASLPGGGVAASPRLQSILRDDDRPHYETDARKVNSPCPGDKRNIGRQNGESDSD